MRFNRIVGKIDPTLIAKTERILTTAFVEFGFSPDNRHSGASKLGGDPLIFSLMVPVEHVATLNIPTAGTDGKRFYWNPEWVCSKNALGIRLTCFHEAGHAIFMHPQRRGRRDPRLWNIAIDYYVNGMVMEDLLHRLGTPHKVHEYFVRGLGNYLTLAQCIAHFQNPKAMIPGLDKFVLEPEECSIDLPAPDEDRELTEEERQEIKRRVVKVKFYYADPNLPDDLKRPEKIYDLLYQHLPKCDNCGRLGVYTDDKEDKKRDGNGSNDRSNGSGDDDSGDGHSHDGEGCGKCKGSYDVLGGGGTVDEHMNSVEDPEKLTKRMSDAVENAKRMAGTVPSGFETELGLLTAPRISFRDLISSRLTKIRAGHSKNDWTRFRTRPMFAGLMIPKRTNQVARFACLLDTSASMNADDKAFGLSQLQALDERAEGIVVPADADVYFDKATKLRSMKMPDLSNVNASGGGGTLFNRFFSEYEKHLGKMDFLIVITDGILLTDDMNKMVDPCIPVYWLITSGSMFEAPFGRVFDLATL